MMLENRRNRILIADNDEEVLIALERTLETEGYETTVAFSHQQVSEMLCQHSFDLFVLDDYLAEVHCVQVLAECRRAGMVPWAIVTYHHDPSPAERKQAMALGAIAWVNKRAYEELTGIVAYVLETRRCIDSRFESMT